MADLIVGDQVKCSSNGNTDYDFYAKVEKIYEHSAFVTMTHYDTRDELNVSELQYRAVIALNKMKVIKTQKVTEQAGLAVVGQAMIDAVAE